MKATELRKGVIFEHEGAPWRVNEFQNRAMGRGAGMVVVKIKNLESGNVLEKTFRSTDSVNEADVERVKMQYLYREGDTLHFMNQSSFEQEAVAADIIGDGAKYLPEGFELDLYYFNGKVIGAEMPNNLHLKVTETAPGAKGDTATTALKSCIVETGVEVMVPLFINVGDSIKVDTRTGQYLERQK